MHIRNPYNYDTNEASRESGVTSRSPSRTVQSSRDEADINTIVKRFGITGTLPQAVVPPTYETFDEVFDYQSALQTVMEADQAFMSLPADVRRRFNEDPGAFVDFCSKEQNLPEMRKLGLALPEKASPAPQAAPTG